MRNIHKEMKKLKSLLDLEIQDSLTNLCGIWAEIGIMDNQVTERSHKVAYHLNDLLKEMIEEEEKLKTKLIDNTRKYILTASQISKKLHIPFKEPRDELTILEKERDMKHLVENLQKEREERIDKWQKLRQLQRDCSMLMVMSPVEFDANSEIPSVGDIEHLQMQVYDVQKELEARKKQMFEYKKNIKMVVGELDYKVEPQERMFIADGVGDLMYSSENLKLYKAFITKLDKIRKHNLTMIDSYKEELRRPFAFELDENDLFNVEEFDHFCVASSSLMKVLKDKAQSRKIKMNLIIKIKQTELQQLWDLCQVGCNRHEEMKELLNETDKVDHMKMKEEISSLEKFYNENKEILDLHKTFRDAFAELTEAEKKCIQMGKYFKATISSRDDKQKHKLSKEVFKLQERLISDSITWEEKTGKKILFKGMNIEDYIKHAQDQLKSNKEAWKADMKGRHNEGLPPVSSTTPFKRKLANITPSKIASKLLKLDPNTPMSSAKQNIVKTPLSTRRINENVVESSSKNSKKLTDKQELCRQNSGRTLRDTPRRSTASNDACQLRSVRRSGHPSSLPSGRRSRGSIHSNSNSFEKIANKNKVDVGDVKENLINETASYEDFSKGLASSEKSFISSSIIVQSKTSASPFDQKFFEPIKF